MLRSVLTCSSAFYNKMACIKDAVHSPDLFLRQHFPTRWHVLKMLCTVLTSSSDSIFFQRWHVLKILCTVLVCSSDTARRAVAASPRPRCPPRDKRAWTLAARPPSTPTRRTTGSSAPPTSSMAKFWAPASSDRLCW